MELLASPATSGDNASAAALDVQSQPKQQPEQKQWKQYMNKYAGGYGMELLASPATSGENASAAALDVQSQQKQQKQQRQQPEQPEQKQWQEYMNKYAGGYVELLASPATGGDNASAAVQKEQQEQKQQKEKERKKYVDEYAGPYKKYMKDEEREGNRTHDQQEQQKEQKQYKEYYMKEYAGAYVKKDRGENHTKKQQTDHQPTKKGSPMGALLPVSVSFAAVPGTAAGPVVFFLGFVASGLVCRAVIALRRQQPRIVMAPLLG